MITVKNNKLYFGSFSAEKLIKKFGSPLYVYDRSEIERSARRLKAAFNFPGCRLFFALKANSNPSLLKIIKNLNFGAETVSWEEVRLALKAGFNFQDIIYTSSNVSSEELKRVLAKRVTINADSLRQIKAIGQLKPGTRIGLRINPGQGAGGHHHIITGGPASKFGIYYTDFKEAVRLADKFNLKIAGLHQHVGSNILDDSVFELMVSNFLDFISRQKIENLEYIDFGGGFGVPYRPQERPLNVSLLGRRLKRKLREFSKKFKRPPNFYFEPGRYLTAKSGALLATVVDIKQTPTRTFVGLNTGFNHLIRPAFYDAYHEIINASKVRGKKKKVSVVGNICESSDFFARDRLLPAFQIGNAAAILNAGAYGYSMSSNYNSRPRPAEVLVSGAKLSLIRKRQ